MPRLSTQDFLEFEQIREGIIILKNKSLRAIVMVSSLNFALKSEEEQEAILYQFQEFLNSLDFSTQILLQSRRVNMIGYLDMLKEIAEKEENDLLKTQIIEYRNFVSQLMAEGEIMEKTFYVIVPFYPAEIERGVEAKKQRFKLKITEEEFQRAKAQLLQRVEFVILGLRRCDLQATPLNSREIIELLWSFYNPKEAERGYYPEIPPELLT